MTLTDTHTHLYSSDFNEDLPALIENAKAKSVSRFFLPNIDSGTVEPMLNLCASYPDLMFPMMGLHPGSVKENYKEELRLIQDSLADKNIVAIGEIGIDLYWDKTYIHEQKEAFRTQINWAKELQLPIVIHARDSFEEIFEILDQENDENLTGVFHCFTGGKSVLEKIQSFGGFMIGLGGVFTFKKSTELRQVVKDLAKPNEILLETDAPYLAPHPFRGKRNIPEYLYTTAVAVADCLEMSLDEIANLTTENSKRLFKT